MSGDVHVRICEHLGGRFPGVTRLVLGFQYKEEAERYLAALKEQLSGYGLTLHPEKTRLKEFGRYAEERRKKRGEGKPEGFDFLGFTHLCSKNRKGGYFLRRKTISKRLRQTIREVKDALRIRMHAPIKQTGIWLKSVVLSTPEYSVPPLPENSVPAIPEQYVPPVLE